MNYNKTDDFILMVLDSIVNFCVESDLSEQEKVMVIAEINNKIARFIQRLSKLNNIEADCFDYEGNQLTADDMLLTDLDMQDEAYMKKYFADKKKSFH